MKQARLVACAGTVLLAFGGMRAVWAQTELFKNTNGGECGTPATITNTARFTLRSSATGITTKMWIKWADGVNSATYQLRKASGQALGTGTVRKTDCHPSPMYHSYCNGEANLGQLPAGDYTLVLSIGTICQNAQSGGSGFITVTGTATRDGQNTTSTTQNNDPCAGKPRSNSPFDPCNTVTVTKSTGSNSGSTGSTNAATTSGVTPGGQSIQCLGTPITGSANGAIGSCVLAVDTDFTNNYGTEYQKSSTQAPRCKGHAVVAFDSRGNVTSCTLNTDVSITNTYGSYPNQGSFNFVCKANGTIVIGSTGNVTQCALARDQSMTNTYGSYPNQWSFNFVCQGGGQLLLYDDGHVRSCISARTTSVNNTACSTGVAINVKTNGSVTCP